MSRVTTDVDRAAAVLRAGGVVAFATETVYGLGARAHDVGALARVFAIKGRPTDHPLIVHIADRHELAAWTSGAVAPAAAALAEACWPGPLTLLVPKAAHVPDAVTGGRPAVGVRVPGHAQALALLAAVGDGVAAPSANRFGRVSPTTAQHVLDDLGADVDVILDGGPCAIGLESTIVDTTVDPPEVLRHGGVPAAQLEAVLGRLVRWVTDGPARAPGMLAAHYAPSCRVELAATRAEADARVLAAMRRREHAVVHDPGPDVAHFARGLYAALRAADDAALDVIVVVTPHDDALGAAINDRLRRAAHRPRG